VDLKYILLVYADEMGHQKEHWKTVIFIKMIFREQWSQGKGGTCINNSKDHWLMEI